MKRILAAVVLIGALVAIPLFGQTEKPTQAPDSAKKDDAPKDKAKTPDGGAPSFQPKTPVLRRQVGWEYKVVYSGIPHNGDASQTAKRITQELNNVANEGWSYAGNVFQQQGQNGVGAGTYVLFHKPRYAEVKMATPPKLTQPPPLVPKPDAPKPDTKKP